MAKDPAFLFYYQDFLVGTAFLSLEERGAYITLLCYMADKGPLPEQQIKDICGSMGMTEALKAKFIVKKGLYINKRLMEEVKKRKDFCTSRSVNRMKKTSNSYVRDMEDVNVNGNGKNKSKKQFIKPTIQEVKDFCLSENLAILPENFIDFYESKGWVVGKTPMVDWRSALRRWARSDFNKPIEENSDVPLQFRTKK